MWSVILNKNISLDKTKAVNYTVIVVIPPYKEELEEISMNIKEGVRSVGRHCVYWQYLSGSALKEIEFPPRPIRIGSPQ